MGVFAGGHPGGGRYEGGDIVIILVDITLLI
jgi:hypothetical protein